MVLRSIEVCAGTYQFEFVHGKIAVAKWDEPPKSTIQWVTIQGPGKFYFEGTSPQDIRVVLVDEK